METVNIVHILKPATVPFCDSDCTREACKQAIVDGTPLLCEAVSREDVARARKHPSVLAKLKEQFRKEEIYRFGLAVLVLTTAFENRKKYDPNYLGRAIFAYLRAARQDEGYKKRTIALLHEVMREPEHFGWDDLVTMFGEESVDALRVLNLDLTPETYPEIKSNPLGGEVYEYALRAHVDWAETLGDKDAIQRARRRLNYLISLEERDKLQ